MSLVELISVGEEEIKGGNDLSVVETIFANVMSNIVFGTIVVILIYLLFSYVYDTYIKGPMDSIRSDITYIKSKMSSILKVIEKLAGGVGGVITDPIGTISNPGKVVGSIGGIFGGLF
jgi:hypothetical protein